MPVLGLKAVNQPGVSVSLAGIARLTNLALLTDLPGPQTICGMCHYIDTDSGLDCWTEERSVVLSAKRMQLIYSDDLH